MRVTVAGVGSVGSRAGGLVVAIAPMVAGGGGGVTVKVGAALPPQPIGEIKSQNPPIRYGGGTDGSESPYDRLGQQIAKEWERRDKAGQAPGTLREWWDLVKSASKRTVGLEGDATNTPGGPVVEVRPQWLADP
jgi:hypothetical protein